MPCLSNRIQSRIITISGELFGEIVKSLCGKYLVIDQP